MGAGSVGFFRGVAAPAGSLVWAMAPSAGVSLAGYHHFPPRNYLLGCRGFRGCGGGMYILTESLPGVQEKVGRHRNQHQQPGHQRAERLFWAGAEPEREGAEADTAQEAAAAAQRAERRRSTAVDPGSRKPQTQMYASSDL